MKLCIACTERHTYSETFVSNHESLLGKRADVVVVHGGWLPRLHGDAKSIVPNLRLVQRLWYGVWRRVKHADYSYLCREFLKRFLIREKVDVVLAEFAPIGAEIMDECHAVRVPLVVYFRGADVTKDCILRQYESKYLRMCTSVSAVVAVSRPLAEVAVRRFGMPEERVHVIPSGTDMERFTLGDPDRQPHKALFVGRFVEKKAPHLCILAFAKVLRNWPGATLEMVGEGPLLSVCRQMVKAMHLEASVVFDGVLPPSELCTRMQHARCLIHHAVTPESGDTEGTPNVIVEASACGIPIVATRHGGIPGAVIDGITGFLVDENDVDGTAECIEMLFRDAPLARRMGRNGRAHVEQNYSLDHGISMLWRILCAVDRQGKHSPEEALRVRC